MKIAKVAPARAVEFLTGTGNSIGGFEKVTKVALASAVVFSTRTDLGTGDFKKVTKVVPQAVEL